MTAPADPELRRGLRYQWHIVRSVLYMQSDMYSSKLPPSLYPLYPLVRIPAWLGSRIARGVRHLLSGDKPVAAEEKMQ